MSTFPRRTFIRNVSLALATASFFRRSTAASFLPRSASRLTDPAAGRLTVPAAGRLTVPLVGLQLYTVRDDMKSDPSGTLKRLSGMGYRYLEHANYVNHTFYGYEAHAFRQLLDGMGLLMLSGHTELKATHWDEAKKDFTDDWKKTLDDALVVGQSYVISPWLAEDLRGDYDKLSRFLDVFNACGKLCKSKGLQFGYHNHDFEFKDHLQGRNLFDIILTGTDPSLVAQQLDIGNLYAGGAKPMDILQQYPGRFSLLHVKDLIPAKGQGEMNDPYDSTVLGQGILGTREILKTAVHSGATRLIIEQESYQGRKPLDDCRSDLAVMKGWGYRA
jgi:sugar phosphate isomerase/epimerase